MRFHPALNQIKKPPVWWAAANRDSFNGKQFSMFSHKTNTMLLIVAIVALSYQTMALVSMNKKINEAGIEIGASAPAAVSFADDGSAPSMVGGC